MARILSNGEWFDQVSPAAFYEAEFEAIVLSSASLLFPDHILTPFRVPLYSDEDAAIADMALVEKCYREWWLVEVEMAHHSLDAHVLPQVRTLSACHCGDAEAKALLQLLPQLDQQKTRDMVKGKPPRVLVILNAVAPDWALPLRRYGAELTIVEIFRSDLNHRVLRVNGYSPAAPTSYSSECCVDPLLPGFVQIDSPAALNLPAKGTIGVRFEGCMTYWERVDSRERVWLAPVGANPLRTTERYQILRNIDGAFEITHLSKTVRTGAD